MTDTWATREFWRKINDSSSHSSWKTLLSSVESIRYHSWPLDHGQFEILANAAAALLLAEQNRRDQGETMENVDPLLGLMSWMQELEIDVHNLPRCTPLKLFLSKAERFATIDDYYGRLSTIISNFQLPASAEIETTLSNLKQSLSRARKSDQESFGRSLTESAGNQKSMVETLGFDRTNAVPIIASLRRYINDERGNEQEAHFAKAAASYLASTLGGQVVDLKPWTITTFDVDIGSLICSSSLGRVFRGRWNRKDVVIKMLKNKVDISPRSAHVNREMETWSTLHHPNILPFLGGNALDNDPFIVIPFLKHRTCRDYIQKHPGCNRLRLLYESSLGLLYLHSENIIHGNLKGFNILIDDAEEPQLCDYGLAKIKADMNSRSPLDTTFWGSQNWMAPELFMGGNLTFQSDVYSFGMTMYEVFADDIPLGHVPPNRLYELVVAKNIRPVRPEANQVAHFSDAAWALAEQCWAKHPTLRIELPTLSEQLAGLLSPPAGGGSLNRPSSKPSLTSVVPSTRPLPRVSQPTGQWEML